MPDKSQKYWSNGECHQDNYGRLQVCKKDKNKNDMFSSEEIGEINIKMNISLDNFDKNKNKFNSDKKNFLDELIIEQKYLQFQHLKKQYLYQVHYKQI